MSDVSLERKPSIVLYPGYDSKSNKEVLGSFEESL